jgi:transcriptional regulator with XRE-family HTH domain
MVKSHPRRKRFRAALALAGMTQQSFAEQAGITPDHLSLVLAGKRASVRLMERVDEFIARHLPDTARVA